MFTRQESLVKLLKPSRLYLPHVGLRLSADSPESCSSVDVIAAGRISPVCSESVRNELQRDRGRGS